MKPRHAPLAFLLGLACARENPGFFVEDDGSGDGGRTSDGTDNPTPTGTTATTATDATATDATTDLTTTTATSSTTAVPAPLCNDDDYFPDVGLGMVATLDGKIIDNQDNPGCMPMQFKGIGTFTDGLQININGCQDGVMGDSNLHLATNFTNNVDLNLGLYDCFTVVLAWQADCVTLRSAVIRAVLPDLGNLELPIAVGVSGSMPPAGLDGELLKPTLEPAPDGACSCDGACSDCMDKLAPGAFQLQFNDINSTVVTAGQTALATDFALPLVGFDITNLRSHVHQDCGPERTHLDWFALLTPL